MPVMEIIERITIREYQPFPLCTPADPFGIDDPCPQNQDGPHRFIADCSEVVCIHCARVAWR